MILRYATIILLLGFIVWSCKKDDPVTEPPVEEYEPVDEENPDNDPEETDSTSIDTDSTSIDAVQRVLLENLTGFRCTNCPQAHDIANNLSNIYGDQLIVVGIHCSAQFSTPNVPESPDYPMYSTEFRTPAGVTYFTELFGSPGLPTGSVNRRVIDNSILVAPSAWAETIAPMIDQIAPANLSVNINNYNPSSRSVNFDVEMTITAELDPGQYFMTAYMVEDSIYDWQLNNGVNVENYLHRHTLRDNVNGTWGSLAFDNGNVGQENTLSFQYTLDEAWKEQHCEIIAYLYHGETREIVQVDKAWIMQ